MSHRHLFIVVCGLLREVMFPVHAVISVTLPGSRVTSIRRY